MNSKLIQWILRIAVAGEFIGHGALALGGKEDWVQWFAHFGVSNPAVAVKILFVIGLIDVCLAVLILIRPVRAALLYMVFWGFWTALLRPIVGAGILDFVESWANWGAPLALLLMIGWPKNIKELFK